MPKEQRLACVVSVYLVVVVVVVFQEYAQVFPEVVIGPYIPINNV